MRVKCLTQEHTTMFPARVRTRTAHFGVVRTNHNVKGLNVNTFFCRSFHLVYRSLKIHPKLCLRESLLEPPGSLHCFPVFILFILACSNVLCCLQRLRNYFIFIFSVEILPLLLTTNEITKTWQAISAFDFTLRQL